MYDDSFLFSFGGAFGVLVEPAELTCNRNRLCHGMHIPKLHRPFDKFRLPWGLLADSGILKPNLYAVYKALKYDLIQLRR